MATRTATIDATDSEVLPELSPPGTGGELDGDGGGYMSDADGPETAPADAGAEVEAVIATGDITAVQEFLAASMDNERKSLRKFLKLQAKLMPALLAAKAAYLEDRARTARLFTVATNGIVSE